MSLNIKRLKNKYTEFMLHSADPKLSVGHVSFWIPALVESNIAFSILVRDEKSFAVLTKKFPTLQICYAKSPVDVESVVNAHRNLKTVLYLSNMAKNIHLLRFNHIRHIFIGTKNSDQLSQFNKSYRAYDAFWGGGEYVIKRLRKTLGELRHLQTEIVGKPQIKEILLNSKAQEGRTSSLVLLNDIDTLLPNIVAKEAEMSSTQNTYIYIPKNKEKLRDDLQNYLKVSFVNDKHIVPFENKDMVDIVAKDIAYVITDRVNLSSYMLVYGFPLVVYVKDECEKYNFVLSELKNAVYFWSSMEELETIISDLIEGKDRLKENREQLCSDLFAADASINNRFVELLKSESK